MRRCVLVVVVGLLSAGQLAAQTRSKSATLFGMVRDCMANGTAEGIDVYVVSPSSPVGKQLAKMDALKEGGSASGLQSFIDAHSVLYREVRRTRTLGHAVTDAKGEFRITGLPINEPVLLLGMVDRKDEPLYYAYKKINELGPFEQRYSLDLTGDEGCKK